MPTMTSVSSRKLEGEIALSLIEKSSECVKLMGPSGRLHYMSENGLALMEIDDFENIKGRMWWDLWPDDCRQTLIDAVDAAKQGVQVVFEAACPTAGGTPKHWRVRVNAVEGGQLDDMIVAYSQDISEEVQLVEDRKRLETKNLALQHFTRVAAHDLRGPIRHNKILAELILEGCGDVSDELRDYAEEIERSATSMLTLLEDLESYHMHGDMDSSDMEPIDVKQAVAHALDLIGETDAKIEIRHDTDAPTLLGHRGQIVSLVKNIVENSVKYAQDATSCHIAIETFASGDMIGLVIADNGDGFPRNDCITIFQPRVRQENSQGKPGSGLGLSIVKQIVENHQGEVWAENGSAAGLKGASIHVRLPRLKTH